MTFTLDGETADRIDRAAVRFGMPKSAVVREAVSEYSARGDRMSESERIRMLAVFDEVIPRVPKRAASDVAKEIAAIQKSRRTGWRGDSKNSDK